MKALRVFEDEELLREAETALDKQRVLTVNLQYAEDQEYASKKRKGNGQSGASFRSTSSSSNEDSDSSSSSSSSSSDEEEEPVIEPEEAERIKRIVDGPRRQQELQVTRNSSSSTTRTTSSTRVSSAFAAPDTDGDPTDNGFQEAAPSPEDMSPVRVLPKPPPGTTRPSKPIIGFATRNSNSAKDKKLFDGAGGGAAQPKKL
ncbi:unnamed protein product [Amoebophrya sp. A25]|nr:unnamed protein product [Amoebophrya sp. A25]|eukprot:GSA25T00000928001.1